MAYEIPKVPAGLLGALDLKSLGVNPKQLGAWVQPVVDIFELYAVSEWRSSRVSSTLQNTGDQIDQVVPSGEIWIAKQIDGQISIPAGGTAVDGCGLALIVDPPQGAAGNASVCIAQTFMPPRAALTAAVDWRVSWQGTLMLPPGAIVSVLLLTTHGAAYSSSVAVGRYSLLV